jgi:hypothetical protein
MAAIDRAFFGIRLPFSRGGDRHRAARRCDLANPGGGVDALGTIALASRVRAPARPTPAAPLWGGCSSPRRCRCCAGLGLGVVGISTGDWPCPRLGDFAQSLGALLFLIVRVVDRLHRPRLFPERTDAALSTYAYAEPGVAVFLAGPSSRARRRPRGRGGS